MESKSKRNVDVVLRYTKEAKYLYFNSFNQFKLKEAHTQKNVLLNQRKFGWRNKVFCLNMGQWKFCLN